MATFLRDPLLPCNLEVGHFLGTRNNHCQTLQQGCCFAGWAPVHPRPVPGPSRLRNAVVLQSDLRKSSHQRCWSEERLNELLGHHQSRSLRIGMDKTGID
eukprot:s265_g25.t1